MNEKPRVKWIAKKGAWFAIYPNLDMAVGYHRWEDAISAVLQHCDMFAIFHPKPRIIGWAKDHD